jgi:hypothetical protein
MITHSIILTDLAHIKVMDVCLGSGEAVLAIGKYCVTPRSALMTALPSSRRTGTVVIALLGSCRGITLLCKGESTPD